MKSLLKFLIGTLFGLFLGWGLGFLRFPLIENNASFWVGFVTCVAFILFITVLMFFWNKNSLFVRLIGKNPAANESATPTRTYALLWILVALFIGIGGTVSSWMIYRQNKFFETQTQNQNQRIREQSELIESIRKGNQAILIGNVLTHVEDELKNNPQGKLSDATIAWVVALSYSLKPYAYFTGDSLSKKKLSPERGQLLLALSIMNIDSASFGKIKEDAPFFGADLGGANLKGADLSGADLKGANLREADLTGANLTGANLKGADLWGAIMNQANLGSANFNQADLGWVELNGANLKSANLDGANLANAKMSKADLKGASFQWAKASGILLDGAIMTNVNLFGTVLKKANLSKVDLTESNLAMIDLAEAHLDEIILAQVRVDKDWIEKVKKWQVTGGNEILEGYDVVPDSSGRYAGGEWLLKKKGN